MRIVLELLQNMSNLIIPQEFIASQHNFLSIYLEILSAPTQLSSAFVLTCVQNVNVLIAQSKYTTETVLTVLQLFAQKKPTAIPSDLADRLVLVKLYSTAIVQFLSNNMEMILELLKNQQIATSHIDMWFGELLNLLNSPSRRSAGEILVGLCKVSSFSASLSW